MSNRYDLHIEFNGVPLASKDFYAVSTWKIIDGILEVEWEARGKIVCVPVANILYIESKEI